MVDDTGLKGKIAALSCDVSPAEVDAGADMTLMVNVSCSPPVDMRGETLEIEDDNGASVGRVELAEFDGEANAADELAVKAPVIAGEHTWRVVWPAGASANDTRERTSAEFSFAVKAHSMHVVVWDVPPTIESGKEFAVKLGVKCSSGCRPDGWAFDVRDHDGNDLASAAPGGDTWPGTAGLYYTEVTLTTPDAAGLFQWEAAARAADTAMPHADGVAAFGVRVVPRPECLLTVVATDKESQAPVNGVSVVVHPYRASTDERGVARLSVPKGEYRLFVSGRGYLPFRGDGEATADVTITAELVLDVGLSDADIWS